MDAVFFHTTSSNGKINLTRMVISYENESSLRAFINFIRIRFCLSYDSLKLDFIAFNTDNISSRKRTNDTNVFNDVRSTVQYAPKCYYKCGHMIFMTRRYPLILT